MRDRLAVLLLGVVVLYEVVQQGEDPEDAQHEEQLREQNLRGMRLICDPGLVDTIICTRYYVDITSSSMLSLTNVPALSSPF